MHPVPCQHLHNTNPGENTSGKRIERSDSDNSAGVVAVELVEHANANSHTDGCDERKGTGHDELLQCTGRRLRKLGNAGSQRDAFEHLMEKNDNE